MTRVVAVLVAIAAGWVAWVVFAHYHHSYQPVLRAPNDSWVHESPFLYAEAFGAQAGMIRDSIYRDMGRAEITVMSKTDPLLRSYPVDAFVADARSAFAARSGGRVRDCRGFEHQAAAWRCVEWSVSGDDVELRQRAYLAGRGNSKLIVLFTAPSEDFIMFGDPQRWLADLHWHGPGLAYAF